MLGRLLHSWADMARYPSEGYKELIADIAEWFRDRFMRLDEYGYSYRPGWGFKVNIPWLINLFRSWRTRRARKREELDKKNIEADQSDAEWAKMFDERARRDRLSKEALIERLNRELKQRKETRHEGTTDSYGD